MTTKHPADAAVLFGHFYATTKESVMAANAKGQITHFNPAAVRLFRLNEEQAIGDHLKNIVIEQLRDGFGQLIKRFFEKSDKRLDKTAVEVTCVRGQGTDIRCEVSLSSFEVNGEPMVCAVFRDVTERKKAAQRLYEAQKMELLEKLASEVAHDVNNLLVGIQGHATLIRMAENRDDVNQSTAEVEKLVKKGSGLMRELRAFARAGGNQPGQIPLAPMDLNDCVKNVVQLLGRTFSERIKIKQNLAAVLPKMRGNAGNLEQAIMSICLNARDAMPQGGEIGIETCTFTPDEEFGRTRPGLPAGRLIRLTIRDNGRGMDAAVLRRVFEPFFTTKDKATNPGLGLTMAYKTIKDHGAFLGIESDPGKGTAVDMFFPMASDDATVELVTAEDQVVPGKGNILLIEDEEVILETTSRLLGAVGYRIYKAKNGEEGIKIFDVRREEIDLVIIDMKMPGKNGLETFQELKKIRPEVRAILTTGYAVRGDTDAMFRLGLRGYQLKPYTLAELSTKISSVLSEAPAPVSS